jgi:hypothetical protein
MGEMTMTSAENEIAINREALTSLREDGVRGPLALNVDRKVRRGLALNATEKGVLWLGLSQEQVRFVKRHLL